MLTDTGNDERTSEEMLKELRTLRDSKATIEFVDILGNSYYVYITSLSESVIFRQDWREGEVPDFEYLVTVNFVQMG
jgi:hypothetical protein